MVGLHNSRRVINVRLELDRRLIAERQFPSFGLKAEHTVAFTAHVVDDILIGGVERKDLVADRLVGGARNRYVKQKTGWCGYAIVQLAADMNHTHRFRSAKPSSGEGSRNNGAAHDRGSSSSTARRRCCHQSRVVASISAVNRCCLKR